MRRFTLAALSLAVVLGLTGGVQAGPSHGSGSHGSGSHGKGGNHDRHHDSHHRYHRDYNHWRSRYYDHRFGCYLYSSPDNGSYYYWCAKDDCYYPTDYCPYGTYESGPGCRYSGCPVVEPWGRPHYPHHARDHRPTHDHDGKHSMKSASNGGTRNGSGSHRR